MEIKIGDMIQSDSGACGVVITIPDNENPAKGYEYIMHWNKGEHKEWGVEEDSLKILIKYSKWKTFPV
jgi:hypothetical protein